MRSSMKADLALLLVSFIWGTSFPVVKGALDDASPVLFLVVRFVLAVILSAPLLGALRPWPGRRELAAGALLGVALALGFATQTLGLASIASARSAFLTSLYVVFVPILSVPLLRRWPRPASLAGLVCALAGLGFFTWEGAGFSLATGDLLTLMCAVAFALHIIGVGAFTGHHDFRRLYLLQVIMGGMVLALFLPLETLRFDLTWRLTGALLVTAGLATALAFYVQNRVQSKTSPTRAAIIFSMEPVFAALAAAVLSPGEAALTWMDGVGALLIITGVLVAEIPGAAAASSDSR